MKNKKWILPLLFVSSLLGQIDIKPMKGYGVKGGVGGYSVRVSPTRQTLIKLEGTIPEKKGYHRVTWKTKKTFYWSNGIATDVYPAVNPASYSKNGKVYTMVGLMPEMIGKTIKIVATYGKDSDTITLKIKER
jgi:hypothetical protein|tara:strand:- start:818 stop:1216 length:399 start_codon:yes stop_codon:yes gene_type:complete